MLDGRMGRQSVIRSDKKSRLETIGRLTSES